MKYAFLVDKKEDIKKVAESLYYGEKKEIDTMDEFFVVYLVNNKKEVLPIDVFLSPRYGYMSVNDEYYAFDPSWLKSVSKSYPLKYAAKEMTFNKQEDLNIYLEKNKANPKFLGFEDITEEGGGKGRIAIERRGNTDSVRRGWRIIESDLQKLGAKPGKDYVLSYSPDFARPDVYFYTIYTSEKYYNSINNAAYSKEKWAMIKKEIIAIWKR